MYDVEALEREWKKYRRKRWMPWLAIALIALLLPFFIHFRGEISRVFTGNPVKNSVTEKRIGNPVQQKRSDSHPVSRRQVKMERIGTEDANTQSDPLLASDFQKNPQEKSDGSTKSYRAQPKMAIELSDMKSEPKEHKRKYLKIEVTDRYPKKRKEAGY